MDQKYSHWVKYQRIILIMLDDCRNDIDYIVCIDRNTHHDTVWSLTSLLLIMSLILLYLVLTLIYKTFNYCKTQYS